MTSTRLVKLMAIVAVLLFVGGTALSWRHGEIRKAQQALALAEKRKAEQDEARQHAGAKEAEARRQAGAAAAHRANPADARRQEAMRLNEKRRRAMEANQPIGQDKRRIPELCSQQYRRPDCEPSTSRWRATRNAFAGVLVFA